MNIINCDLCKNKINVFNQNHSVDELFLCDGCQNDLEKMTPNHKRRFKKLVNEAIELNINVIKN